MSFGLHNEKTVTRIGTTLVWGTLFEQPILIKSSETFYKNLDRVNGGSISTFDPTLYVGGGYTILYGKEPTGRANIERFVMLIPGEVKEGFKFEEGWLESLGLDSYTTTDYLIENNLMDLFADVYVSYLPTRNSIMPTLWLCDAVSANGQVDMDEFNPTHLYNKTKELFPAVDLETADDVDRYKVVEYSSGPKKVYAVYNTNHNAYNGSVPRDIIMKPVLAAFPEKMVCENSQFFLGATDEFSTDVTAEAPTGAPEFAMNPPEDKPESGAGAQYDGEDPFLKGAFDMSDGIK